MIAKIAWKNIWRNRLRSFVVITSIVLGIWAAAFMFAYVFGIMGQRLKVATGYEISHIQLHHPEFGADNDSKFSISDNDQVFKNLGSNTQIAAFSKRQLAFGMVNSASISTGGKIIGIYPNEENELTQLSTLISEGKYLDEADRNKVIIGRKLADKLKVKLGNKIVLTFQDVQQNIVAGAFRIKGIYEAVNSTIESTNLYINLQDLSKLQGLQSSSHEVAILLKNPEEVDQLASFLKHEYPNLETKTWKEISPELGIMIDSIDQYMIIFLIIILLALSFGIVNTMLMAVLERVKEIGVLMSIGMNKSRIFMMIFLETIFIIAIAAPIGLALAYLSISYLGSVGINLSSFQKEAYAAFGIESVIYPMLDGIYYLRILIMVGITALLASLYPSYTAIKLDPVKAIRKI